MACKLKENQHLEDKETVGTLAQQYTKLTVSHCKKAKKHRPTFPKQMKNPVFSQAFICDKTKP